MQPSARPFTLALVALVLLGASASRADQIDFSWQSSFTPSSLAPSQPAQGTPIDFASLSGQGTSTGVASHDLYAVGAAYQPPYSPSTLTMFDNKPFVMTLKLTDGPSGLSDTLTFHGTVAGGILSDPPPLMAGEVASFAFTDWKQSVTIGQDVYRITMQPGTIAVGWDPGPNMIAEIDATPVSNNPEPSSLLLAAMGLTVLGFVRGKRRMQTS